MKKIIKVVCNYNSDKNIYNIVKDIWYNDEVSKFFELTYQEDYEYLFIINDYNGNINCKIENIFGTIQESEITVKTEELNNYNRNMKNLPNKCNKVFYHNPDILDSKNIIKSPAFMTHHLWYKPFRGEIQFSENNTQNIINTNFKKDKKLSIILNNHDTNSWETKRPMSLYNLRRVFANKLLNSDINFDMYGINWNTNDKRFKGYIHNKLDGIKNYEYTICLENCVENGWITEKFTDSILCKTTPIYYGAKDVGKYYKNYKYLDIFDNNCILELKKIINSKRDINFDEDIDTYINKNNPFVYIMSYLKKNEM